MTMLDDNHADKGAEPLPSLEAAEELPSERDVRASRPVNHALRRFMHIPRAMVGGVILVALLLCAVLASVISPYGPNEIAGDALLGPSGSHLMGTDNIGRDVLSVVIYGCRSGLLVGVLSAGIALIVGSLIGGIAGYASGWVETVLMRITEMFQILPLIVLALFMVALWGSSTWLLILAIAVAIWPLEARIVYGQFRALRGREFVYAADVAGISSRRIVFREIMPNALPPVIVQVSLDAGLAILIQAGLGFLGLGDPGMASWGQLLFAAQSYLDTAWWISVFPGIVIALTVIAFNLLGDGLNTLFDPRSRAGATTGMVG